MIDIPSFDKVCSELVLPEWLNGKEASYAFLNESEKDVNHLMETCRSLQCLYDAIASASLNLMLACKNDYSCLLDSHTSQWSHLWMRSQFVSNAILWYNSTFDLMLQPLWIYFMIYKKAKPDLQLTTLNLDGILSSCRLESLVKYGKSDIGNSLIDKLKGIDTGMQENIRFWANTLKHRRKIEYKELSRNNHLVAVGGTSSIETDKSGVTTIQAENGIYNSSKTILYLNMKDAIDRLFLFHKDIIPITRDIVSTVNLSSKA